MQTITYTKIITETRQCSYCHGEGKIWEKTYHNQLERHTCYMCQGSGKKDFTWSEDATNEVADLRRALEETTLMLHAELQKVERLQAGLPVSDKPKPSGLHVHERSAVK